MEIIEVVNTMRNMNITKITVLILLCLFVSCSKDGKEFNKDNHTKINLNEYLHIKNINTPSIPRDSLKIDFVFKHKIILSDYNLRWSFITSDQENNVYLTNRDNPSRVFTCKFNKEGKFVCKFGEKGSGPGEISQFVNCTFIFNEKIYMADKWVGINTYNLNGEFVKKINYSDIGFEIISAYDISNSKIIAEVIKREDIDNYILYTKIICILDENLSIIKEFTKSSFKSLPDKRSKYDRMIFDMHELFVYSFNQDNIFIAKSDPDSYEIKVYDLKGKLLYTFSKDFTKLRFSFFEKRLLKKILSKCNIFTNSINYKNKIKSIDCDYNGRLWVHISNEDNFDYKYDVFFNGIYLNSVEYNYDLKGDYSIYSNLLDFSKKYYLDHKKNEFIFYSEDGELLFYSY